MFIFWCCNGVSQAADLAQLGEPERRGGDSATLQEQQQLSEKKTGLLQRLAQAGISIWASYTAEFLGNPSGGQVLAFRYAGGLEFGTKVEMQRMLKLDESLILEVSGDHRSGHDLSRDIGNLFVPAQIFGLGRRFGAGTLRLYQLSLEKLLADGRLSLLAGRIGMGDEFLTSKLYTNFVQTAFHKNPIGVLANIPSFTVSPVSTWGWRARYETAKWKVLGGIYYSDDTLGDDDKHGFDFSIRSDKGFTPILQLSYKYNQERNAAGLPGKYSVAFYYDSNRFAYFGNSDRTRHGNYGFYFHLDQMVYAEPESGQSQGLTPFLAATVTPLTRINRIPYFLMGGLVYRGLLPRRDQDTTSFGLAYGQFSDRIAGTYEMAFELTHELQVTSWLSIQPDVQYILRPGGTGNIPDAWVLGLELELRY